MRNWQLHVDDAKTPASRRGRLRAGLGHAIRFLRALEHDEDCARHPNSGQSGWCDCGKVIAIEQVQAAAREIRGKRR